MNTYEFDMSRPVHFNMTGKFEAPDENWVHLTRDLGDYELVVMTRGTLYIGEDMLESEVSEGQYRLICPTRFQHGTHPSDCSFYWLHFSYNDFKNNPIVHRKPVAEPLPTDSSGILLPAQADLPRPDRLIILLKQLQDTCQRYQHPYMNSYVTTVILYEIYSQLYLSKSKSETAGGQTQLYSDILDYISWRVRDSIKVSEIAEYFGYNPKYITTLFKRISGSSLKQYILKRKIDLARALLTDTNEPISQIGYEIGFSDNHNFSNTFKRLTGQTPSEYRNSYSQRMVYRK